LGSQFPDATPNSTPRTPRPIRAASERPSEGIVLYNDQPHDADDDDDDDDDHVGPPLVNFGFNGYNEDDSEDMIRAPRLMSEEPLSEIKRKSRRISMEQGRRARGRVSDFSLLGGLEDMTFAQARDRGLRNSVGLK
jgi:hypothetical protein